MQPNSRFDELPEEPLGFDPFKGSFDMDGDPATTNLYVGNLAPQVGTLPNKTGGPGGRLAALQGGLCWRSPGPGSSRTCMLLSRGTGCIFVRHIS